jgi:ketosteroid isomerase-like protein
MRSSGGITLVALAGLCLAGCNKPTPATADSALPASSTARTSVDRKAGAAEILAADSAFQRAMMAKNVDSLMPYYDESVVSMGGGKAVKGLADVRTMYNQAVKGNPRDLAFHSDGVNFSDDGTMAWDYGTYTGTANDAKGRTIKSAGNFLNVWKNVGGHWRIVAEISNSSGPTP